MPPEADTVMVCGFLGCDLRPFNPLIGALPRMLHLHAAQAGGWMGPAIAQAAAELARRGSGEVLERLSEMMYVDTVRRYLESAPAHTDVGYESRGCILARVPPAGGRAAGRLAPGAARGRLDFGVDFQHVAIRVAEEQRAVAKGLVGGAG